MRSPTTLPRLLSGAAVLVLALGSLAITRGSLVYFDPDEVAPFVIEKQPLAHEALWMLALRVHVVAAALALPGCLLLLSRRLLSRRPRIHRWLGRVVGTIVVLALLPAGFYLSTTATAGLPSTVGFVVSGLVMLAAMVLGVRAARARRFVEHRRYVLHVLGQMGVAVVSRAMLIALDLAGVDPSAAYIASLWLPLAGSVALVEVITRRPASAPHRRRSHEPSVAAVVDRPLLGAGPRAVDGGALGA